MIAKVDPEICIGCTLCVATCPEVFKMQGDKAVSYVKEVPIEMREQCRTAASDCPVTAIEIIEN